MVSFHGLKCMRDLPCSNLQHSLILETGSQWCPGSAMAGCFQYLCASRTYSPWPHLWFHLDYRRNPCGKTSIPKHWRDLLCNVTWSASRSLQNDICKPHGCCPEPLLPGDILEFLCRPSVVSLVFMLLRVKWPKTVLSDKQSLSLIGWTTYMVDGLRFVCAAYYRMK